MYVRNLEEISADNRQSIGIVGNAGEVLVGRQHATEYLQEELQRKLVQEVYLK